ncbi:hypothetical protein B9G39_23375 [Zooshikella ganghwensis]|uniref:Uncharacterized protein n=1 Tax=Zooshikella ganghwensis TaxID=202772 RepID=A0A4P9VUX6_9GAMM|nr:hypothetical protein B9G39_23375 [Zooshikella ganghwensis]
MLVCCICYNCPHTYIYNKGDIFSFFYSFTQPIYYQALHTRYFLLIINPQLKIKAAHIYLTARYTPLFNDHTVSSKDRTTFIELLATRMRQPIFYDWALDAFDGGYASY